MGRGSPSAAAPAGTSGKQTGSRTARAAAEPGARPSARSRRAPGPLNVPEGALTRSPCARDDRSLAALLRAGPFLRPGSSALLPRTEAAAPRLGRRAIPSGSLGSALSNGACGRAAGEEGRRCWGLSLPARPRCPRPFGRAPTDPRPAPGPPQTPPAPPVAPPALPSPLLASPPLPCAGSTPTAGPPKVRPTPASRSSWGRPRRLVPGAPSPYPPVRPSLPAFGPTWTRRPVRAGGGKGWTRLSSLYFPPRVPRDRGPHPQSPTLV